MAPSRIRVRRLTAAVTLAAGAACVLAACGSAPAPTATVTISAGAGASTPASTPAPATPATSPAVTSAGPATCLTSGLQAQLGPSQGTAGTIYQVVVLTNTSSASCTLYGYPGVSFVTGQGGSQVGEPASRDKVKTPAVVTLAPGSQAHVVVGVHDAGAFPDCQPTTVNWLKIYPPGNYGALYVQYSNVQACGNSSLSIMNVTAVQAGAGSASG